MQSELQQSEIKQHLLISPSKLLLILLFLNFIIPSNAKENDEKSYFNRESLPLLPSFGTQKQALGVAGPIAGFHNNTIIVAGGANFDTPIWENQKIWHDDIFILNEPNGKWEKTGKLKHPLAYSAVASTSLGVVAMGGSNGNSVFDEVILLKWDTNVKKVTIESLPDLPACCTNGSAAVIGNVIYLAGGTQTSELSSAMNNFWMLDLNNYGKTDFKWEILPGWPGPERAFNITVAQHNGYSDCIYVISGRKQSANTDTLDVLTDVYEFDPSKYDKGNISPWQQKSDIPQARMAGTAASVGQNHFFVLSGADGTLYQKADSLKEFHPGFPSEILGYHTISDTWFSAGKTKQNQVTTHAFKIDNDILLVSGETKPRTRTSEVVKLSPVRTASTFGWINIGAIVIYLLVLVGVGIFFSFRNKSSDDYFRGGQRIPWWAAGCSIFATMLSSLTFMSIPAKAYATNWLYFILNMSIIVLAPFVIHFILPFFRKINATSAYQYLEMRFNLFVRLFASASYILFQTGRMAIVMYLPSLALAAVTPISIETSILVMGILSILYCTLGGLEAVIWTDTIQTFVLLGGASLSFIIIIFGFDNGPIEFFHTGFADNKFKLVDWNWDYTTTVIWVVVLGGMAQQLIPYSSDQGIVQRYMSVSSEKKAANSIWINAGLSFFASFLFFGVGTALYVFYKQNPHLLDPTYQTDAVFPLFIANQLPVGVAGIVIAGIFAAAQSTISTSMNSISTVITVDFAQRFKLIKTDKGYLNLARILTVTFGLMGTGFALLIANADIKSLWDSFISILGLLGGAMSGLFILGIFTKRANGKGVIVGAISGAVCLFLIQHFTNVSILLYAFVGIFSTFIIGYFASLFFPADKKDITGLTLYK